MHTYRKATALRTRIICYGSYQITCKSTFPCPYEGLNPNKFLPPFKVFFPHFIIYYLLFFPNFYGNARKMTIPSDQNSFYAYKFLKNSLFQTIF